MDGKGRAIDNIFIERLWRAVKYEEVYLHDYENVPDAVKGIGSHFFSKPLKDFINLRHPLSQMAEKIPWNELENHFNTLNSTTLKRKCRFVANSH